jgi:hypothetical protein
MLAYVDLINIIRSSKAVKQEFIWFDIKIHQNIMATENKIKLVKNTEYLRVDDYNIDWVRELK